jgi:hypothetical protein
MKPQMGQGDLHDLVVITLARAAPAQPVVLPTAGALDQLAGQLPPRPRRCGQALEGEPDGRTGNDLSLYAARGDGRAPSPAWVGVAQRSWRSVLARRPSAGLCT